LKLRVVYPLYFSRIVDVCAFGLEIRQRHAEPVRWAKGSLGDGDAFPPPPLSVRCQFN
jgi:hypothetical protein